MIVYLNVGGTVYTTTSDTLNNDGGGYLSMLVRNQSMEGRVKNTLSKDGNIFIDRNGTLFEYILDFLRNGRLPSRLSDVLLVAIEIPLRYTWYGHLNTYRRNMDLSCAVLYPLNRQKTVQTVRKLCT